MQNSTYEISDTTFPSSPYDKKLEMAFDRRRRRREFEKTTAARHTCAYTHIYIRTFVQIQRSEYISKKKVIIKQKKR